MKKYILVWVLCIFAVFSVSAAPGGKTKLILQNSTGYEISEIYVTSADRDDWGEDYLVNTTLDDGDSFTINLPKDGVYDIQFIDVDGDSYSQFEVAVKNNTTIELTQDDLDKDYDEEYEDDE
jgi:hypothetical protein